MRRTLWISLALMLVIPGLLFTASCAKKTVKSEASVSELPKTEMVPEEKSATDQARAEEQQKEAENQQELEQQRKLEEEQLKEKQALQAKLDEEQRQAAAALKAKVEAAKEMFTNELVLFDFDSSVLTPTDQERLTRKGQWLKENPKASVIIEGHCDERGSNEYNLALGWRRAEAAKAFLVDLGLASTRISTISYGEERPFATGHNEAAWALNRRAHFVLE